MINITRVLEFRCIALSNCVIFKREGQSKRRRHLEKRAKWTVTEKLQDFVWPKYGMFGAVK